MTAAIPFGDLRLEYAAIRNEVDSAVARVLGSGWFILGRELTSFEEEFARFCGARHAVGVGNGTDALRIALGVVGVGPGDEVVTVSFTAVPTVTAISMLGATPTFADVDPRTATMSPESLEEALSPRTRAIVPVHLYGNPCRMSAILEVAARSGVAVVEDAAQAHGATYEGKKVGTLGVVGCFSFYPSKNLGAYGDAGAVVTDDDGIAEAAAMVRNYGQRNRYLHVRQGVNSRLDELQAAILRAKLGYLERWNRRRAEIAEYYDEALADSPLVVPVERSEGSACHLYVVMCQARERLRTFLAERQIGSQVHYPVPVHLQPAYSYLGHSRGSFPVAESLADSVLSVPLHPFLTDAQVERIGEALRAFR